LRDLIFHIEKMLVIVCRILWCINIVNLEDFSITFLATLTDVVLRLLLVESVLQVLEVVQESDGEILQIDNINAS
jgi:hypothetical protein